MKSSKRLNYVTDLALTPAGGGAYAVNWHAYQQLSRCFTTRYEGPIVPREPALAKLVSKVKRRILRVPGRYTYFSGATLDRNARLAGTGIGPDVEAVMFRSAARWCRVRTPLPYFVYLDAVFHTFFYNTFRERNFDRADLDRIFEEEARFLESAKAVFFESHWGLRQAREAYSLKGAHYRTVGRGGVIEPPERDMWDAGSHNLVTIAMNFTQKGGDVVLEAYRRLKPRFPSLKWHIIGGKPDARCFEQEGIIYEGILNPDDPSQRARLVTVLANAFLLLHPTREDTSPLVITEAAYFGCPSISVNAFAIPELVDHGATGLLIGSPSPDELENSIAELLDNEQRYVDMRRNARKKSLIISRWDKVGALMCHSIDASIP